MTSDHLPTDSVPLACSARRRGRGAISRSVLGLAYGLRRQPLTLGEMFDRLGPEAFGLVLLLLTLPTVVPAPGPWGMMFGTLIGLIAIQVMIGRERLWLPERFRRQPVPASTLRSVIARALPWITRVEGRLRESRMERLAGRRARVLLASTLLVLAIIIALPIPFGNLAPALALFAFSLGFMARDGLAVMIGIGLSAAAFVWTGVLLFAGASIVGWLFGLVGL